MLKLEGQVVNVYKAPDFTPKEGEKKEGGHKVQLMTEMHLKNGETKMELVTLSVKDPDRYEVGQTAEVPVGIFVRNGQVQFYGSEA
ncbi:MAG: hypothetical protein AB1898_33170 [Acidobacteriota bacterium]